jgi:serine/threonine protein kinase
MARDDDLLALLEEYDDRRQRGEPVTPEELCPGNPELLRELRRQIDALRNFDDAHAQRPARGAPEPFRVGAEGRYRPERLHARGGLGEVHVAADTELGRRVALKRIRPDHFGRADAQRRFLREAVLTARLEHPGIVPVYGLVRDERGRPCYAMRLIEGHSLDRAIRRLHPGADPTPGTFAPGVPLYDLRGLLMRLVAACNAVAYAHSRGVVHRDIKPANIMLGPYGETLVVDWGLATTFGAPQDWELVGTGDTPAEIALRPTLGRDAVGTPGYRAPEQFEGRPDALSPSADIYSLGATLQAILTGQTPRDGEASAPFPADRSIPRPLWAICRKAMAPEPAGRYADARDLAADLDRWLAGEPVSAYPESRGSRLARWSRRNRTALIAAASAVIAGLFLAIVILLVAMR